MRMATYDGVLDLEVPEEEFWTMGPNVLALAPRVALATCSVLPHRGGARHAEYRRWLDRFAEFLRMPVVTVLLVVIGFTAFRADHFDGFWDAVLGALQKLVDLEEGSARASGAHPTGEAPRTDCDAWRTASASSSPSPPTPCFPAR